MPFRTPEIQTLNLDSSFTLVILSHKIIIMRMHALTQDPTPISTLHSKWSFRRPQQGCLGSSSKVVKF